MLILFITMDCTGLQLSVNYGNIHEYLLCQ